MLTYAHRDFKWCSRCRSWVPREGEHYWRWSQVICHSRPPKIELAIFKARGEWPKDKP